MTGTGQVGADRGAWTAVTALGAGALAIGTDMFVVPGLLAGLGADLGVGAGTAGSAVAAFALAYAVGATLLGALLGGRRRRPVLIGSMLLFGVFTAATALAPTFPALLAARVASALAASVYVPAAAAAAVAAVPADRRGRALAVVLGGSSVAMAAGAPLGVLLAATWSWRAAFALVGVLAVGTALALARSGAGADTLARSTVRERLAPLRSPVLGGVLAVTLLLMAGSHALFTYLAVVLGPGIGPLIAAFGVGGFLGTAGAGPATDRWGPRPVLSVAAAGLIAVGALVPVVGSAPAAALLLMIGWGTAAWAGIPAQQHRLLGFGAGPAPLLLALNSSAIHLGFATGALLGGVVVDGAGAGRLGLLTIGCCGAGLVLHHLLEPGRASGARPIMATAKERIP